MCYHRSLIWVLVLVAGGIQQHETDSEHQRQQQQPTRGPQATQLPDRSPRRMYIVYKCGEGCFGPPQPSTPTLSQIALRSTNYPVVL